MSKLARKPIEIKDINFELKNNLITLKGKAGQLSLDIPSTVTIENKNNKLFISATNNSFLGLYYSLIKNMTIGVTDKFSQILILNGVGYRVTLSNNELKFNLGYSHPVSYKLEQSVTAELISPTEIKLTSCDKQLLGQVASEIIQLRPAKKDPYKLKGIRRRNDVIPRKVGKKVK